MAALTAQADGNAYVALPSALFRLPRKRKRKAATPLRCVAALQNILRIRALTIGARSNIPFGEAF